MILLDTVTFLWIITGSQRLSKTAKKLYLDRKNKVYLSSISVWEMGVKYILGKLPLPENPKIFIPKQRIIHGIDSLPLEENDVFELEKLPKIHGDPFDRMLVGQARAHDFILLTPDKTVSDYPVKSKW